MNPSNRPPRRLLTVSLVFVLGLTACGDPDRKPSSDTADAGTADTRQGPVSDDRACSKFVIPHRMGYSWKKLNHRVSKWGFELTGGKSTCRAKKLDATFVGGTFSTGGTANVDDTPKLKYGFTERTAGSSKAVGIARRTIEVTIDSSGLAKGTKEYDREALKLMHYEKVIPLIEGFAFDTDVKKPKDYPEDYDPAHGYCTRGIGASLETKELDDETVTLDYRLRFEPGLSPDREPHNKAVPHAKMKGRLDLLLVGTTTSPLETGSVDYTVKYPKPKPLEEDDHPPASETKQQIILKGASDRGKGLYGVQSFNFELTPRIDCGSNGDCPEGETCNDDGSCTEKQGKPGFYIREISVDTKLKSFDESTGEATFLLNGYASNSTTFVGFWGMKNHFTGRIAWIQTGDAPDAVRHEEEFETGSSTFELSEMGE